ncbi:hypothetical protein [uncultured Thiohalocapsa sp.]|uniref:hypothetical protein n=1 Tax=uncultured Thiohalocapsa sp. TaxID=768990 RepID=UPI0025EB6420|nr:hypothetical protein [uncultured Thiohalocapsa sp.]
MQTSPHPRDDRRRALAPRALRVALLLWLALLGACAADGPSRAPATSDSDAADSDGPTLYGRIGVSVDHVSTR